MLDQDSGPELKVPEQTLSELSFAEHSSAGLKKWVDNLPMANVGETARQLYQAVSELNRLIISPAQRLSLQEIIRIPLHYVCRELSRYFLNQPIVLPEKQQKIANLVLALRKNLVSGYKAVLLDLMDSLENDKAKKLFAQAAHRCISEQGQILLRCCQLYSPSPSGLWSEMHTIYKMVETHELLSQKIKDTETGEPKLSRIDAAYKRNLLLSCCRPNQLRQADLTKVYNVFRFWSEFSEVGANYSSDAIFVLNMEQDHSPRYRSLLHDTLIDHYYGFDTAELVSRLTEYLTTGSTKPDTSGLFPDAPELSDQLINHLHQAFGILTKRTFKRMESQGKLTVCFGLSTVHFHVSNKVDFHTQMMRPGIAKLSDGDENIFMTRSLRNNDAWSEAHDAGASHNSPPPGGLIAFNVHMDEDAASRYVSHMVSLVNTSPGGYCIRWSGDMPSNIQAGEIMCVRETESQAWSIAVIRWIRQSKQKGTHIGIELLAPNAMPCGIQLLHKTGAPSEFMRGIILPEINAIGQPRTIITPKVPFQSGQKVAVKTSTAEAKFNLQKRITSTASFSQFELHESHAVDNANKPTKGPGSEEEENFDSLWQTL